MSGAYRIGGREFDDVETSTLEHDAYCMTQLRLAGLDAVALRPGESAELFAQRLLFDVMSSGRLFEMLGGLVLPAGLSGEQWTPEIAQDTGRFLAKLTDPEDKAKAQKLILSLLLPFFLDALGPSGSSTTASNGERETTPATSPMGIPTGMASGDRSSGPSPITTTTAPPG